MRIVISSGHGARIAGASGVIQEVPEARRVTDRTAAILRELGANVTVFHEGVTNSPAATTVAQNVSNIIDFHNSQGASVDLNVSVHFNHSGGAIVDRAIGTETLHISQPTLAARISAGISQASGLINRGVKTPAQLGRTISFLSRTNRPSVLLEVCFVNSREDVRLYQLHFERICRAIAEALLGRTTPTTAPIATTPAPAPPAAAPTPQELVVTVTAPRGVRVEVKQV